MFTEFGMSSEFGGSVKHSVKFVHYSLPTVI